MKEIEKTDIDRYHSFFPQLEYAITEAVRLSPYRSREKFLNSAGKKTDLDKAFYRAKSGLTNLDSVMFNRISALLKSSGVDLMLIDELAHSYNSYYLINSRFTSKNSAFRGAGYLSPENAEKRFYELLDSLGCSLESISSEDEISYEKFLDDATELPFTNNDARTSITNAYAITLFISSNRDKIFEHLSDESFFTRLSLVARIGAWVSQHVGQRGTFNYFLSVLEKAARSRARKSIIGYHAIKWHESNWHQIIGRPFERNHALRAFEALTDGQSSNHEPTSFDGTIILNAAHEAVLLGASMEDIIRSNVSKKHSVGELIKQAENSPILGAYEVGSHLANIGVKIQSLLNTNDLEAAREELNKGWDLFYYNKSQSIMLRYKLKFLQGLLEQKDTGKLDNVPLREAYALAVEIGAFHYAVDTAKIMGWK